MFLLVDQVKYMPDNIIISYINIFLINKRGNTIKEIGYFFPNFDSWS